MENDLVKAVVMTPPLTRQKRLPGQCQVAIGELATQFGIWRVAATEDAVILISMGNTGSAGNTGFHCELSRLIPDAHEIPSSPVLNIALQQLREYANGKRRMFDVPYELYTTPFRRKILKTVADIPYGEVMSYGEVARKAGHSRAVRACGSANATNTIPIIVPCHRVVASNGIGGYGGGLTLKQKLLAHEGYTKFSPHDR